MSHKVQHQIMPTAANPHHHGQHLAASGFKRQGISENDFPLRILVQSDMVGAIIGRSGSTIKQITQQSKARIDVNREDTLDQQEKIITIIGSPESCSTACFKIIDVIINERMQLHYKNNFKDSEQQTGANINNNNNNDEDNDNNVNNNNNNNNNELQNSLYQDSEVKLKILAHNNLIGRLIGRSGASIKKIMEQTSTKINISGNSLNDCTQERTITVLGKLNQVRQAEKVISSKLRAAYMSDLNVQIHAMSQQPYLFNNVPLPYMPTATFAQNPILSSLVNSQSSHASHGMSRAIGPHKGQIAGQTLYPSSTNFLSLYRIPPPLMGFNPTGSLDVEKETVHVYIPSSMVGALIGKSGSAIKEMISSSGASIKVVAATAQNVNTNTNITNTSLGATSDSDNNNVTTTNSTTNEDGSIKSDNNQQELRIKTDSIENESNRTLEQHNSPKDSTLDNGVAPTSNSMKDSQSSPQPATLRQHQNNHNSNNNNNSDGYPQTRKVTIVGTPESQWSAQYLIYRKMAIENGKSDISLMVEIQVPSQSVGKIIGKAGATVKNIQKQTRTTIRLPEDKPSSNLSDNNDSNNETVAVTSVQITGEFQSTQLAQRHIRNLIKERF